MWRLLRKILYVSEVGRNLDDVPVYQSKFEVGQDLKSWVDNYMHLQSMERFGLNCLTSDLR